LSPIALRLAKDAATVGVHYGHHQAAANEVIQSITSTGGTAFPVQAELDTLKGVYALYDALDAAYLQVMVIAISTSKKRHLGRRDGNVSFSVQPCVGLASPDLQQANWTGC
jgi:hypothetical protein